MYILKVLQLKTCSFGNTINVHENGSACMLRLALSENGEEICCSIMISLFQIIQDILKYIAVYLKPIFFLSVLCFCFAPSLFVSSLFYLFPS